MYIDILWACLRLMFRINYILIIISLYTYKRKAVCRGTGKIA